MTRLHVPHFAGIAPKLTASNLDVSQAQLASNAKLWSQGLSPLNGKGVGTTLNKPTGDIQTLFRYAGDWLCWTQDVNVVRGPIANDLLEKLYYTGTDTPRVTTNALWDDGIPGTSVPPASFILGLPAPTVALTAALGAAGNITGANLTWIYTFVRKYSDGTVEESAPSPVSNALSPAAQQVNLTAINNTPIGTVTDYGITHKRIYRLASGRFFFVGEIAIATTTLTDNIATANLGNAIETALFLPPPDGLKGLIALPNGVLAGFKDNVVYLSNAYRPHAFPLANQYAINDSIVGLGNVGTTVIVITVANPWIGRGLDPAGYSFKRQPGRMACTSKRSIASGDFGVLWSTPMGMALCDGVNVQVVTRDVVTKVEWMRDFFPTTLFGIVHDGRYYGWFANGSVDANGLKLGGGFVLDRNQQSYLSTLSDYVYAAAITDADEQLYIVTKEPLNASKNTVYAWEIDPTNPLPFEWKSKLFISPGLDNLAWAQVFADYGAGLSASEIAALQAQTAAVRAANAALADTDGVINGNLAGYEIDGGAINGDNQTISAPNLTYHSGVITFKYWADGDLVYTHDTDSNEPFPLPAGFLAEEHEFEISGAVKTFSVTLASSMEELASV